jgi:Domain of unknown function (DUF4118)
MTTSNLAGQGERADRLWVWSTVGALGAIALALILMPLRAHTSASNLAFAFLVLIIVVAEAGGRGAGLVTAVVSALSLNFFLTAPYLTLSINNTDDIVAFVALAASGLIAAAFGQRRERSSEAARRSRGEIYALRRMVAHLEANVGLDRVLDELRQSFGLGRLVLRDAAGHPLAASPVGPAPAAAVELDPDTLLALEDTRHRWSHRGFRLPEAGGRIALTSERGRFWLDLWEGDPEGLDAYDRQALTVAAAILAREIARDRPLS